MKFVILFSLIAILLIQSSSAAPKPFFDSIAKGIGDSINNGIGIASGIGTSITKRVTGLYVNGLDTMNKVSEHIANTIRNSINRYTNRFVLQSVNYAKVKIGDVEKGAEKLILTAEDKLDDAKQSVNDNVQKVRDDLQNWSVKQSQKGAGTSADTQKQIDALIDELIESSVTDAQSCGDSIVQPVQDLHDQAKKSVEESFPLIDDVLAQIEVCGRLNQANYRETVSCGAEVKKRALLLSPLPGKYSKIANQINRVVVGSSHSTECVRTNAEKVENNKKSVADKIDELIKNDKEAASDNSTTSQSSSTATTGATETIGSTATTGASTEAATSTAASASTAASSESTTAASESTTAA